MILHVHIILKIFKKLKFIQVNNDDETIALCCFLKLFNIFSSFVDTKGKIVVSCSFIHIFRLFQDIQFK